MKIIFAILITVLPLYARQTSQAETDYNKGVAFYKNKDYRNAIVMLKKSFAARNSDVAAYYIASSYAGLQLCDSVVVYANKSILLCNKPLDVICKENLKMIKSCNIISGNRQYGTTITETGKSGGGSFHEINLEKTRALQKLQNNKQKVRQ